MAIFYAYILAILKIIIGYFKFFSIKGKSPCEEMPFIFILVSVLCPRIRYSRFAHENHQFHRDLKPRLKHRINVSS